MEKLPTKEPMTIKSIFAKPDVMKKIEEILGAKKQAFITSVLQITSSNDLLSKADPVSVYNAAMTAAIMDLPLNQNLGFAYIVPYNVKQPDGSKKVMAQFQMGYKGFKQLALRTGQFEKIHVTDVRKGEITANNRMTGDITFKWNEIEAERDKLEVVGYVSFFRLKTGFESTFYMTSEQLLAHGKKYSQNFRSGFGQWKDDFDKACKKTVIKLNLSQNAPLSIDIQRAIVSDQAVVNDVEFQEAVYVDNEQPSKKKEITGAKIELP
jgi:recombination protein RecT